MKKVFIGILAIIMVLGIVGCSSTPETKESNTTEPTETSPVETDNQKPELTVEPTQTEASSSWQIVHYVDDFGDETNEVYLQGIFTGEFSNTATSNSDLTVIVGYDYYIPEVQTNLNPSTYSVSYTHLATGGSAIDAITLIKQRGGKNIKFMCLVSAPEGIKALQEAHPDVDIYTAAVDEKLNENAYIVPGLGDAGDRIFGTL